MDGQWKIYPIKSAVSQQPSWHCIIYLIFDNSVVYFPFQLTKAELDDFKLGRAIPNCVLEARPLCEDFHQLLYEITMIGVKPPYNELTLRLYDSMPPRRGKFNDMPVINE